MAHKAKNKKTFGVFIKKIDHKKSKIIKPKEDPTVRVKIINRNGNPRGWNMPKPLNFKVVFL